MALSAHGMFACCHVNGMLSSENVGVWLKELCGIGASILGSVEFVPYNWCKELNLRLKIVLEFSKIGEETRS